MSVHSFYKTRLIFNTCNYIATKRQTLLQDLVAYTNDPVRYMRRVRLLVQLSQYESDIVTKIDSFDTDDKSDLGRDVLEQIMLEVDTITNISS